MLDADGIVRWHSDGSFSLPPNSGPEMQYMIREAIRFAVFEL